MRKTLLLVFIHGFKGGDDTFGTFPEHLRALLSHALPNINVVAATYPRYETRGDLQECVTRFRDWLLNKVIDIEVASQTPSPTIDPSVHTILVGHSMGGIVAAETFLSIANEKPLASDASKSEASKPAVAVDDEPSFMFPHIQGVLALDTPFLGLAPEMIAHGLEGGHKMASSAYNTWNEVNSMFGWGNKSTTAATTGAPPAGMLPAPSAADAADAASAPKWQWGKYAMFAGAAGAIAAGGAAALYSQREKLSAGWTWAGSHLLFVGDLAKAERLRQRVENVNQQCSARGIGAACFYTNLGRGAREGYGITESLSSSQRTFCNLPVVVKQGKAQFGEGQSGLLWIKAVNDKAKDETNAHVSMFFPKENPGFYTLGEAAKEVVASWLDQGWYTTSSGPGNEQFLDDMINPSSIGKDWEGLDDTTDQEEFHMREEQPASHEDHDMLEGSIIVDKSPTASTTL